MIEDLFGFLNVITNVLYLVPALIYAYSRRPFGALLFTLLFIASTDYHLTLAGVFSLLPLDFARVSDHMAAIASVTFVALRVAQLDVTDTYVLFLMIMGSAILLNLLIVTTSVFFVIGLSIPLPIIVYRTVIYDRPYVRMELFTMLVLGALMVLSGLLYLFQGEPGSTMYAIHFIWHILGAIVATLFSIVDTTESDLLVELGVDKVVYADSGFILGFLNKKRVSWLSSLDHAAVVQYKWLFNVR